MGPDRTLAANDASDRMLGQLRHLAILGNFPPRRCGIATFTEDNYLAIRQALPGCRLDLYAMDDGQVESYPAEVTATLPEQDPAAYRRLAERINASGAQALWLQHEFGIFGGKAGGHLLVLLDRLTVPYAVMLHTVLAAPDPEQRRVVDAIIAGASTIVVMAEKGRQILRQTYGVPAERVTVIPHGIPDQPLTDTGAAKAALGFAGKKLILTFGLLSPDKGIAEMIEAMPAILAACPDAHYLVLGQTHPNLLKREGESYREGLKALADQLGVGRAVSFINRFTTLTDLTEYLSAADVYVTPYRNRDQITSGTLSYAVGLGKPVVATPFVHATELLADDHGRLVPFGDSDAMSAAVASLLTDDEGRLALSRRAYARGRTMTWPKFAETLLTRLSKIERPRQAKIPMALRLDRAAPVSLGPVERMTDATGMLQHSIFTVPDRNHGYCIDDNARALMLMSLGDDLPRMTRERLSRTYAAFIQHAWNEHDGCYRNFMSFDRRWLESCGSEDSNGRTLWALGVTAASHCDPLLRRWATQQFDRTIGPVSEMASPRTLAFAMLGAAAMVEAQPGHGQALALLKTHARRLCLMIADAGRPDWSWYEAHLAYDNTRLPEALIRAGRILGQPAFIDAGLETLTWIADLHRTEAGHFRPVGTESFGAAYTPPQAFDQQPVEAWAMMDACEVAWQATHDPLWLDHAEAAWRWFVGDNDLGLAMVSPETGECFDGLSPVGVNLNSGAESILAWQFAARGRARLTQAAGLTKKTGVA
ncbi:glycosyltransferase family 4 protein [soil metagenome]